MTLDEIITQFQADNFDGVRPSQKAIDALRDINNDRGLRKPLLDFVVAMEKKLRKNDHKTCWADQPIEAHIKLMKIEQMEFDVALEFLGDAEAAKECIDIANFAMIIYDKLQTRIKDKENADKTTT